MRNILTLLFVLFSAGAAYGQDPTHFAGTWLLDKEASFARESDRDAYKKYLLELTVEGDKVVLRKDIEYHTSKTNIEMVLFPGGKGETNTFPTERGGRMEIKSKTKLKDNSIVREFTRGVEGPLGMNRIDRTTEKFTLSQDGKYLVYTQTRRSELEPGDLRVVQMGNMNLKMKLFFRRL